MVDFSNFSDKELIKVRDYFLNWSRSIRGKLDVEIPEDEFGKMLCEKFLTKHSPVSALGVHAMLMNTVQEMADRFEKLTMG